MAGLFACHEPQYSAWAANPAPFPPCVAKAEDMQSKDLESLFLKHHGELGVDLSAGCLRSVEDRDYPAILLALPAVESGYAIRISAPIHDHQFMIPRAEFLDAQFRRTRSFGAAELKRRATGWSMVVFVDMDDSNEEYLLLYADREHLTDTDQKMQFAARPLYVGTGVIIRGAETLDSLSASESGKLVVELQGPRWDKKKSR